MEVHYNPTIFRNVRFEMVMHEEVELYLTSPSNTFVVFNGKAEIEFEGTLPECYVYSKWYRRNKGFDPCIYSKEAFNEMINALDNSEYDYDHNIKHKNCD